eukprot:COSAG01_NODE_5110_length_4475_cov_3.906764_3_plen_67_part_00
MEKKIAIIKAKKMAAAKKRASLAEDIFETESVEGPMSEPEITPKSRGLSERTGRNGATPSCCATLR